MSKIAFFIPFRIKARKGPKFEIMNNVGASPILDMGDAEPILSRDRKWVDGAFMRKGDVIAYDSPTCAIRWFHTGKVVKKQITMNGRVRTLYWNGRSFS